MGDSLVSSDFLFQSLSEFQHRCLRLLRGNRIRRPGPDISHRHGAEALPAFAVPGLDLQRHVEQHGIDHDATAELDRRAVLDQLLGGSDGENADVGGFGHGFVIVASSSIRATSPTAAVKLATAI